LVEEGKTVGINTVVGRITDGANGAVPVPTAQPAAAPPPPPQPAPQQAAPPPPPPAQPQPLAAEPETTVVEETAGPLSPLVRKMARENNIDLAKVKGTGAGGRITKQDLETYLASASSAPKPQPAPQPAAPPPQPQQAQVPPT